MAVLSNKSQLLPDRSLKYDVMQSSFKKLLKIRKNSKFIDRFYINNQDKFQSLINLGWDPEVEMYLVNQKRGYIDPASLRISLASPD